MSRLQETASGEEVTVAVTDVLSRREFQKERSMLEDFLEWLFDRLELGQGAEALGEILFWLLIGTLAGLTIYFGIRFLAAGRIRRRKLRDAAERGGPTVGQRVELLRREAADARAGGDLRLALRKNLFALVLGLGSRGDLDYRDAWTNRELLFRGRPAPKMRDMLASVVTELEPKEFGREPVLDQDVDHIEELCRRYLGALEERAA